MEKIKLPVRSEYLSVDDFVRLKAEHPEIFRDYRFVIHGPNDDDCGGFWVKYQEPQMREVKDPLAFALSGEWDDLEDE